MEYKDYYQVLGVSRDADEKEIKRAFRRLARQYHPDVNPGDAESEERFKEINEAYEVLADPEKRAKYNQLGSEWKRYQQAGGQPGGFDWDQWTQAGAPGEGVHVRYGRPEDLNDIFGGGAFSDFFSQIFGAGRGDYTYQPRPQQGQDYEQEVEISLREAYIGTTRLMEKDGRRLQIRIPAGARTGTRVRMAREGAPGPAGGPAGDLYLRVRVIPDERFEREGNDLKVTVTVPLYTAVLGGQVQVPTLDGMVRLRVPAGTQNGRLFRLRGKGMPELSREQERGDLYARLEVQLPTSLSERERELFSELQQLSGGAG